MTLELAKKQQSKLQQEIVSCDSTIVEYQSRKEIAGVQLDSVNALVARLEAAATPAPEPPKAIEAVKPAAA